MATDSPVATEPPDPEGSRPPPGSAGGSCPGLVEATAALIEDVATEVSAAEDTVACLLQPESHNGETVPGRTVTELKARYTTPPPSSTLAYSIVKKKTSPGKKNMGSDSAAYCKEDPVQKAPDFEDKLLAEIDPVSIQISAQKFKGLLDGKDIPAADLARLKDFCHVDFSNLGSKAEDVRYDPLCDIFNSFCGITKYEGSFKIVATHYETSDLDFRCDLALYPDTDSAQEAYLRDIESDNPDVARCAWAYMTCPIEVKCKGEHSGYGFPDERTNSEAKAVVPLLHDTPKGRESRAQFTKYNAEILLRQPRTHVYSLYITGESVRFFRFDRAGCVASTPISLKDDFELFSNMMYRLLNLSPEGLGFDSTTKLASATNLRKLRAARPARGSHLEKYYQDYLSPDPRFYRMYQVSCPAVNITDSPQIQPVDASGKPLPPPQKTLIIGKPSAGYPSPTGRCTKGYVAFDVDARRFVFLKEQWRAVTRRSELDTYRRLHEHDVRFIATPVAGGDVEGHRTKNHKFMAHRDAARRPVERVHCRLVTQDVGRPLESYSGSYYLIRYITHAVCAHRDAWEKAGVLHHDVSAGNVMIRIDRDEAFLNDWDLAKWKEDLEKDTDAAEPAGVSGTWPFKSALALKYPFKPPELADDIESFVYIVLFMAMRFHRHELSSSAPKGSTVDEQKEANARNHGLAARFYDIFYSAEMTSSGCYTGGQWKVCCIQGALLPIQFTEEAPDKPTPLTRVLQECYEMMHKHYRSINMKDLEQYAASPKGKRPIEEPPSPSPSEHDSANGAPRRDKNKKAQHPFLGTSYAIEPESFSAPPTPSSSGSSRSSAHSTRRVMDDYRELLRILCGAFFEDGAPLAVYRYEDDKLYDQCVNGLVMTSSRRKAFSGASLADRLRLKAPHALDDLGPGDSASAASAESAATLPAIVELPEDEDAVANTDADADKGGGDIEAGSEATNPPRLRTTRARTTRKAASPGKSSRTKKAASAKLDSPPRRAKAAMQETVARKAAAVPKSQGARKRKAGAANASAPAKKAERKAPAKAATVKKTAAKAPAKVATTAKAPKAAKAAGSGATRRSVRLVAEAEEAPLPPATGKRKRAEKAVDVEEPQPTTKTTRKRKVTQDVEPAPAPAPKKPLVAKARAAASRKIEPRQEAPARRSSRLAAKNINS